MDSLHGFGSASFASCENASAIESLQRNRLINALAANRRKPHPSLLSRFNPIRKALPKHA